MTDPVERKAQSIVRGIGDEKIRVAASKEIAQLINVGLDQPILTTRVKPRRRARAHDLQESPVRPKVEKIEPIPKEERYPAFKTEKAKRKPPGKYAKNKDRTRTSGDRFGVLTNRPKGT